MPTIRREQMEVFERAVMRELEQGLLEHVRSYLPHHLEILTEDAVRRTIQLGIEQARCHGFESEQSLYLYVSLTFMLGSDFAADPELPWAEAALSDATLVSEPARADRLWDVAMEYLDRVAGPNNEHLRDMAFRRSELSRYLSWAVRGGSDEYILEVFRWLYPEKYEAAGEAGARALIGRASARSNACGISSRRGLAVMAVLMFLLGAGFDSDPRCPWASALLSGVDVSEADKVNRLYDAAIAWLNRWPTQQAAALELEHVGARR